ncbi:hypothetical protein BDZ89DRAFT_1056985 [Hymenopellis radicata]|nr:hypothetical protein BDZ89DRAFT_1056985 [Hymenopellis radicata]
MEPLLFALISGTAAFNLLFSLIWFRFSRQHMSSTLERDPESMDSKTSLPSAHSSDVSRPPKVPSSVSPIMSYPPHDTEIKADRATRVFSMQSMDTASMYSTLSAPPESRDRPTPLPSPLYLIPRLPPS